MMVTPMRYTGARGAVCYPLLVLLWACGGSDPELGPGQVIADADASNPTVAMDPAGRAAYVAWVDDVQGPASVWLRVVDADGSVGTAVRVNDIDGDAAPHFQAPAKVAVGPEGNVYVAWTNATPIEGRPFPASDLRFARSTDGGRTFEPAITVNDDRGGVPASHTFHDLAVMGDGRVVISWLDSRRDWNPGAHEHIHAGAPVDPEVPGPDVRIAVSTDGGRSFGPSRVIDQETCPCCRTTIAVGPGGAVYLAWRKIFEGEVRDIVVAASTDGGETFGEPRRVAADDWVFPGCPHAGPSLAVDPDGVLHVAWYTGREDGPGLYHARSTDRGHTFEPATALVTGDHVPPSQTGLSIDADGTLWVAWEDRGLTPSVRVVATATGRAPDPDRASSVAGTYPSIATGGEHAALVWLDEGRRIMFRRLTGG